MKLFSVLALLVAVGSAIPGRAITLNQAVRTTVPFDFAAGDERLPAGTYTISKDSFGLLRLQNADTGQQTYVTAMPAGNGPVKDGKLVFRKYNGQYFLKEVMSARSGFDSQIAAWKLEKRAQHEAHESISTNGKMPGESGSY